MSDLQIGDKVQTMLQDGSTDFQEVHFFAHADANRQAAFITISHVSASLSLMKGV